MPLIRENFGRGDMFNENRTGGDNRPRLLLAVGGSIWDPWADMDAEGDQGGSLEGDADSNDISTYDKADNR